MENLVIYLYTWLKKYKRKLKMLLLESEERIVLVDNSDEVKQKVFDELMKYFMKHDAFSGEVICQSDNCIIEATDVLANIADNIIKFKVNYK